MSAEDHYRVRIPASFGGTAPPTAGVTLTRGPILYSIIPVQSSTVADRTAGLPVQRKAVAPCTPPGRPNLRSENPKKRTRSTTATLGGGRWLHRL